jgi:hypothetical protein
LSNVVVHFPDGSREFRYPPEPLVEGDIIWHDAQRYRVVHVGTDDEENPVVTVEPDPDDIGDVLSSERGGIRLVPVD